MFPASLAGLRKTSVSAICFTLNANKGHHLRHLGFRQNNCSKKNRCVTPAAPSDPKPPEWWWVHLAFGTNPYSYPTTSWMRRLISRCSMQYALMHCVKNGTCQGFRRLCQNGIHIDKFYWPRKIDVDPSLNITPAWHGARSQGLTKPNNSEFG